jgi:NADH dehydrogenase
MNIIIFGASGFLGGNLLPLLLEDEKIKNILIVTHTAPLNFTNSSKKLFVVSQKEFFLQNFDYKDFYESTVICLSGNYSPKSSNAALREANFEIPRRIIDFLGKTVIRHFILASSVNVRLAAANGYARYKREIENYIMSCGIPYTIFRPSLLFGRGDTGLSKIINFIRRFPVVPVLGDGKKLEQPIHVSEAAAFFHQAVISAPVNQILEIGGLQAMSYNDMLITIAGTFRRNKMLLHLPARPVYRILSFFENIGLRFPVNSEQILHIDTDLDIDNGPALSRYHVKLRPFKEWLREYIG